uniref:E4 protein n=1 Tax=Human papillomavirus TaxID=10566 RepID=A0A3R5Z2P7_9PAPI|nr:MAG: E4 protein [Human papillomavirus]
MILTMLWFIQIGILFIIKTFQIIGTRSLVKQIIMDFTMMISMGKEYISCCLHLRLTNMAKQDVGLCITKIQLFPLLLLAHQSTPTSGSRASPPTTQGNHPDAPHRKKDHQDDLKTYARRGPQRPRLHWDLDGENDKENQNPNDQTPEEPPTNEENLTHLPSLLSKWERDIDRFREQVYHDLDDLKRKLGIPTSY